MGIAGNRRVILDGRGIAGKTKQWGLERYRVILDWRGIAGKTKLWGLERYRVILDGRGIADKTKLWGLYYLMSRFPMGDSRIPRNLPLFYLHPQLGQPSMTTVAQDRIAMIEVSKSASTLNLRLNLYHTRVINHHDAPIQDPPCMSCGKE